MKLTMTMTMKKWRQFDACLQRIASGFLGEHPALGGGTWEAGWSDIIGWQAGQP